MQRLGQRRRSPGHLLREHREQRGCSPFGGAPVRQASVVHDAADRHAGNDRRPGVRDDARPSSSGSSSPPWPSSPAGCRCAPARAASPSPGGTASSGAGGPRPVRRRPHWLSFSSSFRHAGAPTVAHLRVAPAHRSGGAIHPCWRGGGMLRRKSASQAVRRSLAGGPGSPRISNSWCLPREVAGCRCSSGSSWRNSASTPRLPAIPRLPRPHLSPPYLPRQYRSRGRPRRRPARSCCATSGFASRTRSRSLRLAARRRQPGRPPRQDRGDRRPGHRRARVRRHPRRAPAPGRGAGRRGRRASGRSSRSSRDETITEVMVNGPNHVYIERARQDPARRQHLPERRARPADHRPDHHPASAGASTSRARGSTPACPTARASTRSSSRSRSSGRSSPIRKFAAKPFTVDDLIGFGTATAEMFDFLQGLRRGPAQRLRLRRHRLGQDDDAQRPLVVHPERRADRHDRGRRRAAAPPGARRHARVAPAEPRGRGRDHDPRPAAQRAAHAPRPDHRRRVPLAARRWTCSRR